MRLQELHPALVHFPITLLPVSLGLDAAGRASGNRTLMEVGKLGMAATAGSAAISAVAGLLAQEASRFDRETHDILVTHRNLNLAVIGLTGVLAARRSKRERPSLGYLLAGLAGIGVMTYSAYLGGRMVYEHGVGVSEAGGLREDEAPYLVPDAAGETARVAARHVVTGLRDVVEKLAAGELAPWLTRERDHRRAPRVERESLAEAAV
jgi:uncharacterized membrane protein